MAMVISQVLNLDSARKLRRFFSAFSTASCAASSASCSFCRMENAAK